MYVDDLIITDVRTEDINSFKHEMAAHFRMSDLGALLLPRHRGETGEGGTHARAKRVCLQAVGEERHGGVQAMRDSDGGTDEVDEGQYYGKGRSNTLPEHR